MFKKLLATVLTISMVVPAAFAKKAVTDNPVANDNRVQVLTPSGKQVPQNQVRVLRQAADDLEVVPVKTPRNQPTGAAEVTREDQLWTLKHVDDNAEYYLGSGAAGDTFAIVFTPAAPAVVKEVYAQWYTPGNANVFGADYSAEAAAVSPDGECSAIARGEGPSPIGTMRTTITPNTIEEYVADWSAPLDIGGEFIVGDSMDLANVPPFVIAFVKGGDTPQPLADATDDQGNLTYTWFGGPWTDGLWGRYSGAIDVSMLVKVTYPWGAPIAVQSMNQMNNTYNTTGPFTIEADLFDDVGDNNMAIDENDEIVFHWTVNGVSETTGSLTASETGADGNGIYTYDIAGTFAVGDVIEYWITSVDNDGLEAESVHLSFTIKEAANPDADLLIVADSENDTQAAADLYRTVADEAGLVYEYWNTSENAGIDASIIDAGWSNIIVYGWGNKTVPPVATEADPGYADFMDAGGNLVLIDQDWYYGHGLPANPTFAAGDLAYDYFGIGSGVNDPEGPDTVFVGLGVTDMDTPFAAEPLTLNPWIYWGNSSSNWGDQLTPASGSLIFAGANDGSGYGVAYDGGTFKAAYIGFQADAAVDTAADGSLTYDQFDTFLNGVFDWMGITSPPQISEVSGPSGTVLAGPYDVSAMIVDADGDAITATLKWSADGETWNDVSMTADGDMYSAQIPNVTESGYYWWFIMAEAAGEMSTAPGMDSEPFMFERFAPQYPVLVNFNGGVAAGYPGAYYFGIGDYTNYTTADFHHDIWEKGLSSELASAYETIYEITTFGPLWDNSAVIAGWLEEGAKEYFLAGDEWFGALSGWTDLDFVEGDFEYDILGVSHSYNDINASSTGADAIEAVEDNILTGALYTMHTTAGDTLMYDPYYEIEAANWLDGFEPVNASDVNMTTFGDDPVAIGLNREVGDDKIVFLGFDPLSINATPYTWYGFAAESPQTQSLDWFGITGVNDEDAKVPADFALAQNYPNPFNPTTTISFSVPAVSDVKLAVYNLLGQKVVDLVNNAYQPGTYNVVWNGTDALGKPVSSGIYFYRMTADGFTAQHKMLYLK
ncbi:MAG: T9SS type A sorting domain-containing protein [Lentisphaeria bacterium]|nr:T9SS type A sorting domain-containing protein [Candidatus Neomarinimicrobiota bacterium]MCF7843241.1 T9SS type A sorting domain-containing protein [Lentisphaeria bacterium]